MMLSKLNLNRRALLAFCVMAAIVVIPDVTVADEPTCADPPPPPSSELDLQFWPVHERDGTLLDAFEDGGLGDPKYGPERTGIWNSFGEFQGSSTSPSPFLHTGIDINSIFNGATNEGDFVRVVADGDIWAVPAYFSDQCQEVTRCKIHVKSVPRRYIYYYAHLNIRPPEAMPAGADLDTRAREAIQKAVSEGWYSEPPVAPPDVRRVTAGTLLAGSGRYDYTAYNHLHFSIFDACENYDGLSPLDFLPRPYVDEELPVVEDLALAAGNVEIPIDETTDPLDDTPGARCTVVDQDFDVVAKMHDVWDASPSAEIGNEFLGVHKALLRLQPLPAEIDFGLVPPEVLLVDPKTWYDFSVATMNCPGPTRGAECPGAMGIPPYTELLDYIPDVLESPGLVPRLGQDFTDDLFRLEQPFDSCSRDYAPAACDPTGPQYHHEVNADYGVGGPIEIVTLAPSQYQLSVQAFDQNDGRAVMHRFFVIGSATGDLLIRDHKDDVGAIPSNMGGEKFYKSTDIRQADDPGDPAPAVDSPVWDTLNSITAEAGVQTKIWVRVINRGCATVSNIRVALANADFAFIATGLEMVGPSQWIGSLGPGEGAVVGFLWTPQVSGHRCLLAAASSALEDPSVATDPLTGDIDFSLLEERDNFFTPFDNNLAQHNLKIAPGAMADDPMDFGNPFDTAIDLGLDFDCNDFPIKTDGAIAEFVVDYHPALAAAWSNVPRTTLLDDGVELRLQFHGCRISLPAAAMPAQTVLDANMMLALPSTVFGTFSVDLTARVNGAVRGGASYFVEQ